MQDLLLRRAGRECGGTSDAPLVEGRPRSLSPSRLPASRTVDAMPAQLSVPGLDTTALPFRPDAVSTRRGELLGYTLFLALLPQPEDALRITRAAADLRSRHGLVGPQLQPGRLHITLHAIAGFIDTTIPLDVVDATMAAAGRVVCPPLPIVFDRVLTFSDSNAFVLRCNASSDAAIARLRQSMAPALRRVGLHPKASRTPHMTMLYDRQPIAEHPIEPICWTATRFSLILSHVGIGHHQRIGQWVLADRAA